MDQDFLDLIYNNYTATSEIMFPIILFLLILLIRDLSKYSKISDKINNRLKDLAENIEEKMKGMQSGETVRRLI